MAEAGFELRASSQYYPAMFQTGFPQWSGLTLRIDSAPLSYCKWNALKKKNFFFFGHTERHVGSYFTDQGSNPPPPPRALETLSLTHWTTREVPVNEMLLQVETL